MVVAVKLMFGTPSVVESTDRPVPEDPLFEINSMGAEVWSSFLPKLFLGCCTTLEGGVFCTTLVVDCCTTLVGCCTTEEGCCTTEEGCCTTEEGCCTQQVSSHNPN